jgi:hypothetical protein
MEHLTGRGATLFIIALLVVAALGSEPHGSIAEVANTLNATQNARNSRSFHEEEATRLNADAAVRSKDLATGQALLGSMSTTLTEKANELYKLHKESSEAKAKAFEQQAIAATTVAKSVSTEMQVNALEASLRTLNEKVAAAKKRYATRSTKIEDTKKANNATVIEIERLRVLGSGLTAEVERLEHQNRDLELGNQERKVELEKLANRTQALNVSVLAQEKVATEAAAKAAKKGKQAAAMRAELAVKKEQELAAQKTVETAHNLTKTLERGVAAKAAAIQSHKATVGAAEQSILQDLGGTQEAANSTAL